MKIMRLTDLSITNYRALRDVTIPLSRFGCLIGENNAGKSSFLQALSLFFSGTKLAANNFFDESKPIRVAVTFEGISEADLARLTDEHRTRVAGIVKNGRLVLVRAYDTTGKSSLLYNTLTPTNARFSAENIAALVKGSRVGQAFVTKVVQAFPELEGVVDVTMNQDAVRQKIQELADALPDDQKTAADQPLPTGIDKSIEPMLPDPIYIPAVKDLADDIKTTESTPFGKILAILLQAVESKLPDAQRLFEELNAKLNCVQQPDGTVVDGRLDEVKLIESTVEKYVRESFSDVALRITIPPPELKTIFSSARIYANDGVDGLIDSKGDGLRRAIVFSILRSYVELKAKLAPVATPVEAAAQGAEPTQPRLEPTPASYLLLFEEPELFLHPKAQHILFDALRVFAKEHHVLVTTHSPMFFGPGATETFVKLRKVADAATAPKPFTLVRPIDLSDMAAKDQFQIICFENNNAAFFADTVALVEGDSDYLLMPHIARTLDPSWDVAKVPVVFARITGKGNIRRYREFFARFGVRVPVIADLDLLVSGFDHIAPDNAVKTARDNLLAKVDELIVPDADGASARDAKHAHDSGELRGLWRKVRGVQAELKSGNCTQAEHDVAVDAFFAWQRKPDRLAVLTTSTDVQMLELKHRLLERLRAIDVYVLERGAIEQYYPDTITGADKPSRAQEFCSKVATRDAILACCGEQTVTRDGAQTTVKEFELIFHGLFRECRR
ncbi:MAG: ATP-dependent endonuclease [Gemmatimonadetes bacterium]|nr:ATP-dependent endonuclease [Gemmatimonadota bacterium]MBK7350198.1 ATP-dependent endonuclease [Gemmatimonadota bacterium]MBK7785341.1 ATP-dependent endonuclease [Gemmatimonadota bacterium]